MSADPRTTVEECSDSRLYDFQNTAEDLSDIFNLVGSVACCLKLSNDSDDNVISDVLCIDSFA